MEKACVSAIAAIGENRELGRKNELIWRISDDLKRVKELTTGHPIIMGRKTFESIGRPLPNRTNIVITRSNICIDGVLIFGSLEKALEAAHAIDTEEIFIFGGASLYAEALPTTDRLYLTRIHDTAADADAFFPDYSDFTKTLTREERIQDGLVYEWLTLERGH